MDFWPSEDQDLIQQSFREFLATESAPERVRKHYDSGQTFDRELWNSIRELGFAGSLIPAEHGGAELTLHDTALISEELGRHTAPLFLEGHTLAGLAIAQGGTDAQQQRLLEKLASGEQLGTLALAVADSGDNWRDWQVTPESTDKTTVHYVPCADVADVFIIGCTDGRLGLLERANTTIETTQLGGIDQSRQFFSISFDASAVELIPNMRAEKLCDALLILLAADAFGAAGKMVEIACAYTMEREQFGQPIAQFQAVKHQLAHAAVSAVTGRGLFWRAAMEFDEPLDSAARSASMAKAHITEQAYIVARAITELHGGIGYTWESNVHFYFKRAMFNRAYLGVPDIHRQRCAELAGWTK